MKNIIIYWQYLKHSLWLGIILLIMGVTAGVVSSNWIPVPVGLIIAGVGVIGIWLVVSSWVADQGVVKAGEQLGGKGDRASSATFGRNLNYLNGGNALIATISVLVILLLVNFLAFRYSLRLDLTENQIFSLSPQSQAVVQKLQQPVKIWVFESNPNPADRELLENYRRQGTEFSYEFVDPQLRLSVAEQFKVQSIGEVHIEAGTKRQLLQVVNNQQRLSESSITNGLELIQSNRTPKVYFLQGHGEASLTATERGLSQLNEALGQKNYEVIPLTLAATGIPKEAEIIVIAGAKRNLLPEEAQALKTYLGAGGNLLVLLEARTNIGLDELFRDWGVVLDNRVAIDGSGNGRLIGLGAATSLVTTYGDHPITRDLGTGISLFPLPRSIDLQPVTGVTQTPLVITNEKSWAEANPEQQPLVFDQATDKLGPLNLAVALSRPATSSSARESRLVIFGNATFATNSWFEQQLNGDLILNAIGWLRQQDNQALSIRPKSPANRRINLNSFQYILLGWTALVIIPLVGFSTAGVLWWRRR